MSSIDLIFNEKLVKKKIFPCNSLKRVSLADEFFVKSAVLFTIIPYRSKPYELVLIHRAEKGAKHRGEMSFPGGKFEPKNDITVKDTALRETEEEIGVPRDKVRILGCLNDFPTLTQYIITPFVGVIQKEQKLVKDEREVQNIVKVPINFFVKEQNFREQKFEIEGDKYSVFYFDYKNTEDNKTYTIWGATAFMIMTFLKLIYDFNISKIGLLRPSVEKLKLIKNYLKYKKEVLKS